MPSITRVNFTVDIRHSSRTELENYIEQIGRELDKMPWIVGDKDGLLKEQLDRLFK